MGKSKKFCFALVGLSILAALTWRLRRRAAVALRQPTTNRQRRHAVTWDGNRFVALDDAATVLTSPMAPSGQPAPWIWGLSSSEALFGAGANS